jgi:pimeloyl-ACP methyl ester carboxylesterase
MMSPTASPVNDILYPAIAPYHRGYLQVSALHQLYFEPCGQPQGIPVLFVHGGPGGSCEPIHRRFFDPQAYRIVLFDQRGAGRSRPTAELTDNTTPHLIADTERVRQHLGIDRWLVFGGSWGSTLGLAFQRQEGAPFISIPRTTLPGVPRRLVPFAITGAHFNSSMPQFSASASMTSYPISPSPSSMLCHSPCSPIPRRP